MTGFNDLYLRAAKGERTERPPIWIMRQAGRYLPQYRATRAKAGDFLSLCKNPELAAEVTLQPVDLLGVDAAILFSDILVPVEPMGFRTTFEPGPVLDPPVRTRAEIERLRVPDAEEAVPYVFETIRILRRELERKVPLIGFGGAPLTLAAYMVEGRGSKNFERLKGLLYGDPPSAHLLLEKTADAMSDYLLAQVRAGAQAIQLFDSWAGILDAASFREYALPYVRKILAALRPSGVPLVYFAVNASHLYASMRGCGADVIGADWRLPLSEVSRLLGGEHPVQGNLDPAVLYAPPETIARKAREVVEEGRSAPAHVFNLGHGVLPDIPVPHVEALVRAVKAGA